MKTNQKYAAVALLTAVAVAVLSLGSLGFAQTVTPVTCTIGASTIAVNQPVLVTAAGGNGTFSISGTGINSVTPAGNQFAVSFANTGTSTINVTSGGLTGSCNVNVIASAAPSGALMCSPAAQTVTLGQTASFTASGGNGNYTWSASDLTLNNPTGSGFSASYASTGVHTLTVTSNGSTATCDTNVLANPNGTPAPVIPVTPGLPDTGGGYGQN